MHDRKRNPLNQSSKVSDVLPKSALAGRESIASTGGSAPGELLGDVSPPKKARLLLHFMLLSVIALLIWASIARINQVTRAPAQLVMPSRTQLIQSPDGGVVTVVHVKEGDRVHAGQILATLQKERASAAVDDSRSKVAALRIALTRLQAEVYEKKLIFEPQLQEYQKYIRNQTDLFVKRQTAYKEDIKSLEGILRLAQKELSINQELESGGDVSPADILRLQRSVADIQFQIVNKRNKYFQDAQAEMTRAQEELSTQEEQLRDRVQGLEHTELTAPMVGVINNIKVNTVGGVVRPGDTVMELLPDSEKLQAETKIATADIAFVEVGQKASIKLDAYDSSIFGAMDGEVVYISPDAISEETRQGTFFYYRVRVRIDNADSQVVQSRDIRLRPGLTAYVEIKAMDRTVLSYLIKPLIKTLHGAMLER